MTTVLDLSSLDPTAQAFVEGLALLIARGCAIKAAHDKLIAWPKEDAADGGPPWALPETLRAAWPWQEDVRCFVSYYPGG